MRAGAVRAPGPSAPVLGAAALLLAALTATIAGRPGPGDFAATREGRRALASVDLRFEDRPDGAVSVLRAGDGDLVATLAPGTEGFVRATVRSLARDRRLGDLGREAPFRLASWPGGGLSLEDTATGRTLDLRAFGPTQTEAFARLLPAGEEIRR